MEKLFKKELKAFGKKLKSIRKAKGLSQLDLEVESGISRTEISRIENGLRNIEFYTIVVNSCHVDPGFLHVDPALDICDKSKILMWV